MSSLATRMKRYESVYTSQILQPRTPMILRLDGCHFHSVCRGMEKPFDENFIEVMNYVALYLCKEVQNVELAYLQSDEISLLLIDYKTFNTQQWFGGELVKMVSVSAAIAATAFAFYYNNIKSMSASMAAFDSRAFTLPKEEVNNYFVHRQQDWTRNSVQMLARAHFSHKELHEVSNNDAKQMLLEQKDVCWEKLPTCLKRGRCVRRVGEGNSNEWKRWEIDNEIPIFSQHPEYVEKHVVFDGEEA